ncbi:iron ABC transporter permease [Candidatus Bathyarchaeota archaeon]|nr:MAG: iron ABC transporter permease [Candidatus Bathyarchaeota archaeon]
MPSKRLLKWRATVTYLILLLFLSLILTLAIGPVYISPTEILEVFCWKIGILNSPPRKVYVNIILQLRLPRILFGFIIGASLSVSGMVMQALFRNPMASPYVIGVSSGSALGAAIAMNMLPSIIGIYTTPAVAFLTGLFTLILVYNLARVEGRLRTDTLLLAGIAVSYFFSAIISILVWIMAQERHQIVLWLMGGLWGADWIKIDVITPITFIGLAVTYMFAKDLNAMLLGEETAQSLGTNVELTKKTLLVTSALMISASVSFSGMIGFVGLVVPHVMRLLVGPDHRILIPSSALAGGIFLAWSDALARVLMEIPVGVVTAISGVPFFIYLLKRRRSVRSL